MFIFLFVFFLLTQGIYFLYGKDIGEARMSYERVIGVKPDVITKMNVGFRTQNGWEFTTKNKDFILLVFNYLNKKQFIQQEVIPTTGSGSNHPHYIIHFFVTEDKPHWVSISINADDGKTIWIDGKYYTMTNSTTEEGKEFFASLKSKWKQMPQQTTIPFPRWLDKLTCKIGLIYH